MPLSREQRDYCVATAQVALEASERLQASNSFRVPEATDPDITKSDKDPNDQKIPDSPANLQQGPFVLGVASSSAHQAPPLGKGQNNSSSMTGCGNFGGVGRTIAEPPALRRSPRFSRVDRNPPAPAMGQHERQPQGDGARTVRRSTRLVKKAVQGAKAKDEFHEDEEAEPTAAPSKGQRRPASRPRTAQMVRKGKFYADEILDVRPDRGVKGGYRYLTSWQGYTERTWEPADHFDDPAMVEEFKDTVRREGKGWKIGE